ncbi:unnamed protein product [Allacma fusca]|uniref:DDE Tnp4 domain-containing protein n=1 Tax=Allacma fusca TaxID=39272 RepID=A0A8J2KK35_9HEXA|nr:unnamed protein product [Allacma fusca]
MPTVTRNRNLIAGMNNIIIQREPRVKRYWKKAKSTELRPWMEKRDTFLRQATPIKKRVMRGVKCLASCSELKDIAGLFGVGVTTVQECYDDFIVAVNEVLPKKYIRWPATEEQYKGKAKRFEELWNWPMAVAAIDGCHFPYSPPIERSTDYYNFKGWYSCIAFAACDADGIVTYVKAGIPGRANDSTIFRSSQLFEKIQRDGFPTSSRFHQNVRIPYHVIGDSAFRLESWCLKPYTHRSELSPAKTYFNSRLSRARRIIENVFGQVKGRWRRILKRQECKIEKVAPVILAAFTLHNYCNAENAMYEENWDQEVALMEEGYEQPSSLGEVNNTPSCEDIRTALVKEFELNPLQFAIR